MLSFKQLWVGLLLTTILCACNNPESNNNISYLALGDSYTIGESLDKDKSWSIQLTDSLRERGFSVDSPDIIAQTGWTTGQLKEAISKADPAETYDLVSLLIGVNNQYQNKNFEQFETEFEDLLKLAISFSGNDSSKVFVVSIPDYGVTPFGQDRNPEKIANALKRYNNTARNISRKYDVSFINITPISKKATTDLTLIANDGLHPSEKMYRQWVAELFPVVLSKIQQ